MIKNPIIIIPARLASTRFPNKPLADIKGKPMIVRVYETAKAANVAEVLVAAGDQEIVDVVRAAGGKAIMTDPNLPSGSDRIYQALLKFDTKGEYDSIINVQGDLPTVTKNTILSVYDVLKTSGCDIATLGAYIETQEDLNSPSVVKAIAEIKPGQTQGRALYFTRVKAPANEGKYIHHIGIYAYTIQALESFINSAPSELEKREKLEQLRALSAGQHIEIGIVEEFPLGVDTPADLERILDRF